VRRKGKGNRDFLIGEEGEERKKNFGWNNGYKS